MVKELRYINSNNEYSVSDGGAADKQTLHYGDTVMQAYVSHNITLAEVPTGRYRKYISENHSYYTAQGNSYVVETENASETLCMAESLPNYLTGWQTSDGEIYDYYGIVDQEFVDEYYNGGSTTNLNLYGVWGDTKFLRVIVSTFDEAQIANNGLYFVEVSDETSYDDDNIFGLSPKFMQTIDFSNRQRHLQLKFAGYENNLLKEVGSGNGCPATINGTKYATYFGYKAGSDLTIGLERQSSTFIPGSAFIPMYEMDGENPYYYGYVCEEGLSRDFHTKGTEIELTTTDNVVWTTEITNPQSDKTLFVPLVRMPFVSAVVHVNGTGFVEITDINAAPAQINNNQKTVVRFPGEFASLWAEPADGYDFNGWFSDEECTHPVSDDINGHQYTSSQYDVLYGEVSRTYYADFTASGEYLTFTAESNDSKVGFCYWKEPGSSATITDIGKNLQYSTDEGVTWNNYTIGVGEENIVYVDLPNIGDSVYWRGNNENLSNGGGGVTANIFTKCFIDGSVYGSGDVTSLLNNRGGDVNLTIHCFSHMFYGCTGLLSSPVLPSTNLQDYCYNHMFEGCTNLVSSPELPAVVMCVGCYNSMFKGCESLETPPSLNSTTLDISCYAYMFENCSSLNRVPDLPASTLKNSCYQGMFRGCTSITEVGVFNGVVLGNNCCASMFHTCTRLITPPDLLGVELKSSCYSTMFYGCTSLSSLPVLGAEILAESCYNEMFRGCTSIVNMPPDYLPVNNLENRCYSYMFSGCSSLTNICNLPATNLKTSCYEFMFSGCTNLLFQNNHEIRLMATTLDNECYKGMFSNCSNVTEYVFETINFGRFMFSGNNSCVSFTINDTNPPDVSDGLAPSETNSLVGLPNDCTIYVPAQSVTAYQTAPIWSDRYAYIQAIPTP